MWLRRYGDFASAAGEASGMSGGALDVRKRRAATGSLSRFFFGASACQVRPQTTALCAVPLRPRQNRRISLATPLRSPSSLRVLCVSAFCTTPVSESQRERRKCRFSSSLFPCQPGRRRASDGISWRKADPCDRILCRNQRFGPQRWGRE